MNNDDVLNNPEFRNINPDKLNFLRRFAGQNTTSSATEMASVLMQAMNTSKEENVQFTSQETDLMFSILKSRLSPAEQAKADMIYRMMNKKK
ncbi:MAG: hypothetical protein HFG80_14750 [Eubacterium sp.]|nr:hypothetical protein [Eubacterium sp.]